MWSVYLSVTLLTLHPFPLGITLPSAGQKSPECRLPTPLRQMFLALSCYPCRLPGNLANLTISFCGISSIALTSSLSAFKCIYYFHLKNNKSLTLFGTLPFYSQISQIVLSPNSLSPILNTGYCYSSCLPHPPTEVLRILE